LLFLFTQRVKLATASARVCDRDDAEGIKGVVQNTMHSFIGILGAAIFLIVFGDAFETIVLPRRVRRKFRLTRLFYRYTWRPFRFLASHVRNRRRRETALSFFGPFSLIILLLIWAVLMIVAFAMMQWAAGVRLATAGPALTQQDFALALYYSGTTFTTLGLGDIHPVSAIARSLTVIEAAVGFGFLALVIGYLPIIYQAFSRRESNIVLLDARAGSPPTAIELIRRYANRDALDALDPLLQDWDRWAAQLLESHISYPVLTLFRSQHDNESWLGAVTTILDTCALLMVGVRNAPARQAQLTFAMARHVLVDLAQVIQATPHFDCKDRLPPEEFGQIRRDLDACGASLRDGSEACDRLLQLRRMYEPYALALADYLVLDIPPWRPQLQKPDNWQTSAWERAARHEPVTGNPQDWDEHA
jgi:Flp pilus assembly protein protease CpaA